MAKPKDQVWVVEFRWATPCADHDDTVVMHIASSEENAIAWCRAHLDAEDHDAPWKFAIWNQTVDSDWPLDEPVRHLLYIDRDGELWRDRWPAYYAAAVSDG